MNSKNIEALCMTTRSLSGCSCQRSERKISTWPVEQNSCCCDFPCQSVHETQLWYIKCTNLNFHGSYTVFKVWFTDYVLLWAWHVQIQALLSKETCRLWKPRKILIPSNTVLISVISCLEAVEIGLLSWLWRSLVPLPWPALYAQPLLFVCRPGCFACGKTETLPDDSIQDIDTDCVASDLSTASFK